MAESTGGRQETRRELLDRREAEWAPQLRRVSLVAEAEIPEAHRARATAALGGIYDRGRLTATGGFSFLTYWPACLVASMTGVAVTGYVQGKYWPALWTAARYPGHAGDQQIWGEAFASSLARLGLPRFENATFHRHIGPVLMHAGIPAYCLGDFFRLLAERRRQDPALDADGFLAWATAPGRQLRLSGLDKPAQRFLLGGGEYAHDIVDRTLDLLERLAEPDPDLDGIVLPDYMTRAAREEVARGGLDLSGTRRASYAVGSTRPARQARPRIALDPYGAGVQVLLPAVDDMPDGVARWVVTADGERHTVQSRALWVGAAEAAPETSHPLSRPVRTVLVSLVGREELTSEIRVVDQADPLLFFGEDGRRLSGITSLPRARVWIMHPEDHPLEFTGAAGSIIESPVPFGWDGWRLVQVPLTDVQSVRLDGCPTHPVEFHARPRLECGEPVPGVATPYGSPVYAQPPTVFLPATEAGITWHIDVRRVGDTMPLVARSIGMAGDVDIWDEAPRPVLGAFEVTVRGPLGRGLRRTVVVAEGLSVRYQPGMRLLTAAGLARGSASLAAASGAVAAPASLRFPPGERSHPVEYRTDDESEPLLVTPPHAALLCPGGGVTTWSTSLLHLVTEDFAETGRLLVRLPGMGANVPLDLEIYVRGRLVQSIPASGQRSTGLAGFELERATDTIAAHKRAELVLNAGGTPMPVGYVRPRTLASGADLTDGRLVFRDAAAVDGLTAAVYLGFVPWRPPVELPVAADGTAELPPSLVEAGPLRVLLRVDDPWAVSSWPGWPGSDAFTCLASGVPLSLDQEECELSRFVAGMADLPPLTGLGRLWRLAGIAADLVRLGARGDLAERCTGELLRLPRAALLTLVDQDLGDENVVRALISTGLAAAPVDNSPWTAAERSALERLWAAYPAAAAIASGAALSSPGVADVAMSHCGDALAEMLAGRPDPHPSVGRFGPDAERMATWAPDQVAAMWQAAAVVPAALLDVDTRVAAARRMFDGRNTEALRATATVAKTVAGMAERVIDAAGHGQLGRVIAARRPADGKGGWLGLPVVSIAMALTARLAARGDARCMMLEREFRGKWANLALHAPDLVAIDLVRAEALLVGVLNEKAEDIRV